MAASLGKGWRSCVQPALGVFRTSLTAVRPLSTTVVHRQVAATATAEAKSKAGSDGAAQEASTIEATPQLTPFSNLEGKVSTETLQAIKALGHKHMTPVQDAVFAHLPHLAKPLDAGKEGARADGPRDLMVRAKTGTGKTLAFLVPALEHRLHHLKNEAPRNKRTRDSFANQNVGALILSPTRELATQIANEAKRLTRNMDFGIHEFVGGVSKYEQRRKWRTQRRDVVVATTGRLRDLMENEPGFKDTLMTSRMLILDEADTMLDMGFREDIEEITSQLPEAPERQTFVFSATISKPIQQVAREVLHDNHVYLNTVSEEDSPVHEHIPQYHTVVPSAAEQIPHILRLLAHDQLIHPAKSKTIVFLPTTKLTMLFAKILKESKRFLPAGKISQIYELHSKLSMNARQRTSANFRKDVKGATVLVTSDVSARGVDYPGVTRIIQVGIPSSPDQYVHRVGRTGRAGGTNGRGDLVLLPFEQGFLRAGLADMPLKPVTVDDLKSTVLQKAAEHDADPASFMPPSKSSSRRDSRMTRDPIVPLTSFETPVQRRIEALDETSASIVPDAFANDEGNMLNDVEETFTSLLGYYISRTSDLRITREGALKALQQWTTDACGLTNPPSVSASFLARLGINNDRPRRSSFGSSRSGSGSFGGSRSRDRDSFSSYNKRGPKFDGWAKPDYDRPKRGHSDSPPSWQGRGSQSSRRKRGPPSY